MGRGLAWFGIGGFVLTSCKAIVGVEESSLVAQQDGGAGASGTAGQGGGAAGQGGGTAGQGGGTAGQGGGEAGQGGSGPCTNVETDPQNCGQCGRACAFGMNCVKGLCDPEIRLTEHPIVEIVATGDYLYWWDDSNLLFRLKEDDFQGGTQPDVISVVDAYQNVAAILSMAGGSILPFVLVKVNGQRAVHRVGVGVPSSEAIKIGLGPNARMLRASGGNVYWLEDDGIHSCTENGDPYSTLGGPGIRDYAVGNAVFYLQGEILMVSQEGGVGKDSGKAIPDTNPNMTAFENHVIWSTDPSIAWLRMWDIDGSSNDNLVQAFSPTALIAEQKFIYFADTDIHGSKVSVFLTSPPPNTATVHVIGKPSAPFPTKMAMGHKGLYWTNGVEIMRSPPWHDY